MKLAVAALVLVLLALAVDAQKIPVPGGATIKDAKVQYKRNGKVMENPPVDIKVGQDGTINVGEKTDEAAAGDAGDAGDEAKSDKPRGPYRNLAEDNQKPPESLPEDFVYHQARADFGGVDLGAGRKLPASWLVVVMLIGFVAGMGYLLRKVLTLEAEKEAEIERKKAAKRAKKEERARKRSASGKRKGSKKD